MISVEPPWELLAPFEEGAAVGFGWVLESLTPIRSGAATMMLRHAQDGVVEVAVRRNCGAPLGIAHTPHLDFLLMNGGGGMASTEGSVATALSAIADALSRNGAPDATVLASLQPAANSGPPRSSTANEPTAQSSAGRRTGLAPLTRRVVDLDGLLAELAAADPMTLGLGFQPARGPAHEGLGVLNILGTGACDSDCLFCCEKFVPSNRLTLNADATRQLILDARGRFDMLFFASGEPTIHPKLFEHVELAKRVGFTGFGMSSHFRTFADPHFTLKTLQAGFQYFDISLHAADAATQIEVNPIEDGGASLHEALKGLAVLYRLAEALGIRISVTQKIVISRLNVTRLYHVFRAGYDRGVRNFILQPVRTFGLPADRQAALAISEEGILPHLNALLRDTEGLGAAIKPYGFSRQNLFSGSHIETEQNRVKNVSGKARAPRGRLTLPKEQEDRPTDGRHWVEINAWSGDDRFAFAADSDHVVLDEALQRGADLPFGCRMGSCGMCCARLLQGRIDQSTQMFLTDEQLREGYVLLCQAHALSDVTLRVCTDEEIDRL